MAGLRVVELASWTLVPAAGAILADWGADVIKVEHPRRPDPQRALVRGGLAADGPNALLEQANRGKRSLAIDIAHEDGLKVLYELVSSADVFLTNWLPAARRKRRVDVSDIKAINPNIIYARGHGVGPNGPEADLPGFDSTAYIARGGFARVVTPAGAEWPIVGASAIGDLPGAMSLAGGISAALLHRLRTGESPVVDVSLLGQAMWTVAADLVAAGIRGEDPPSLTREQNPNPISLQYRTKDDRYVRLAMFESDRYFAPLCLALGHPELGRDPRFVDAAAREAERGQCVAALDEVFAGLTLAELRDRLEGFPGAWGVVQRPLELLSDPQAVANGYLRQVGDVGAQSIDIVRPPVVFDESEPVSGPAAPEHGQHTEEILLELGRDWDDIGRLHQANILI